MFDLDVRDGLIDAMLAVSSGLELERKLHTIVHTAMNLVNARYGALGVIGTDCELASFSAIATMHAGIQVHRDVAIQIFQNDGLDTPHLLVAIDLEPFSGLPKIGQCLANKLYLN